LVQLERKNQSDHQHCMIEICMVGWHCDFLVLN